MCPPMADNSNDLDPVVKPQDDTYEKVHNIILNDVHKINTNTPPLSSCGLTTGSRFMVLREAHLIVIPAQAGIGSLKLLSPIVAQCS